MDYNVWIGKKVFIKTNSDRVYTGVVLDVSYLGSDDKNVELCIILVKDKFGTLVGLSNKEIKMIDEERK